MAEDVGIRLSLQGRRETAAALRDTEQGFDKLGDSAEAAGKQAETSGKRFDRTRSVLGSVGRGLLYGAAAAGTMAVAAGALGIKTAASMQTAKIGFTTMLGSAKRAGTFLKNLSDFAAKTPFEFPELQTAAGSLVSAGINANKVIPIMTTLGDVTAGMGTGSEGIKRATVALQQMNAAGRITGEDLNQLRDAGVPVYDLLAAATGKSKEEVVGLAKAGKLGRTELEQMMKALETGKGLERFEGLMAKQSQSIGGRWSTLKDTVTMGLAKAVKPALPLIGDLLDAGSKLADQAMPKIKQGVKIAAGAIRDFTDAWRGGGMKAAFAALGSPNVSTNAGQIGGSVKKIGSAVKDVDWGAVKDGLGKGTADTVSVFGVAVGVAADHVDDLAKYLPAIVAGFVAWKAAQALANVVALASIPLRVVEVGAIIAHTGALRANTAGTKVAAGAQRGLNIALLANPIGLVVLAIVALVAIFVIAYNKSDRFKAIVDTIWNMVLKPFAKWIGDVLIGAIKMIASGLLGMAANGVMAFKTLLKGAFWAFDGILAAAEAGLGWIGPIGDKIKGARAAFNEFGDSTINKLQKVEDRLRKTQTAIDGIAKDRSSTITVYTNFAGATGRAKQRSMGETGGPGRANGGHVMRGQSYIVGERRAERFVPSTSGRILPHVPDHGRAEPESIDPGAFGGTSLGRGGGHGDGCTHVHLDVDGREMAEVVMGHIGDDVARK